jgi:hypothetical protein
MTKPEKTGLRRGLTHYGDPDFALYLRRSFARSPFLARRRIPTLTWKGC